MCENYYCNVGAAITERNVAKCTWKSKLAGFRELLVECEPYRDKTRVPRIISYLSVRLPRGNTRSSSRTIDPSYQEAEGTLR